MFSKILVNLIDQAIVPAILLLTTRLLSVFVIASMIGARVTIDSSGFVFENPVDYYIVNSYSVLIMVSILFVGIAYNLVKAYVFHDSHINPKVTARVFTVGMSSFIQTSFDLYSQGAVWLSYMFLMLFATAFMMMFTLIYPWVFAVTLVLTLISVVLFIYDVEREFELKNLQIDDVVKIDDIDEEYLLKF